MSCTVYSSFKFSYLHAFYKPNNIITKFRFKKLNLIFKVSQTKRQINISLSTHKGHKEWREDGKALTRCHPIALEFWDEFNANFVLLYFSSYRSIKIWHFYFKNETKKTIRQCIKTPEHFNIKKHLALVLKKNRTCTFLYIPN